MKRTLWRTIVWCSLLGVVSNLRGEADQGAGGTVRERFRAGWNSSKDSPPETERNKPIYTLYWVAFQDMLGTKMTVSNLMDRDRFMTIMKADAAEADVTHYTSNDLQNVYEMHTNVLRMFLISPNLPPRIEDWPPPDLSWTNESSGVSSFIKEHGGSMYNAKAPFLVGLGFRTEPITGLPWREISRRKFRAVTYEGILFTVLDGFGPDSAGVAWNPRTNRFPSNISGFLPLGRGWYAWQQGDTPAVKRYEGEMAHTGQPAGGANGSQPTRAETNSIPSATGYRHSP